MHFGQSIDAQLIGPVDGDGHCGVDGAGHERVGGGEEVGRHVRQYRDGITENEGRYIMSLL